MSTRALASADEMLRYMSAVSSRRADQVIEQLDGDSAAANTPASERRREPREPHEGQVSIRTLVRTTAIGVGGASREVSVEVFARNLSKLGFGFVAPPLYLPEAGTGSRIALPGDKVFEVGKLVDIAIVRLEGKARWMPARVVRTRLVSDGFVECGVEFV
jgi:hypothetical protein